MGKKGCLQNECAFGCVKEAVATVTVNVEQVSNEVSLAVTLNFKYCLIQTWLFLNHVDDGILMFFCLKHCYFDHFCTDNTETEDGHDSCFKTSD